MRRPLLGILVVLAALAGAGAGRAEEGEVYARCNIKVLKGNEITWVNWQASPMSIAAGTPLLVTPAGAAASVRDPKSGSTYTMDVGSGDPQMLEKFFTKTKPSLDKLKPDVRANVEAQVARIGMTKEEAYVAMGPPVTILSPAGSRIRTNASTYEDILRSDLWIYARRRFGKDIGVGFDTATGRVNRTEGIWK